MQIGPIYLLFMNRHYIIGILRMNPKVVLEPYEPYPELPVPVGPAEFGIWTINHNGDHQYAIPVNTGVAPWEAAAVIPALPGIPAQAPRPRVSWQQVKKNGFYNIEAKKWAEWMILTNPFPIPGFPQYSDYILLLQKYKLFKLNAASTVPQPEAALIPAQALTQIKLPAVDTNFESSFRNNREWTLPGEANRTIQYINPYAPITLPQVAPPAPGGWMAPGFMNLTAAGNQIAKWLFVGPQAGEYPKEVWPKNNMRIHGAPPRYLPLENLPLTNIRRVKRKSLGGWQGGRKKTMRKYKRKRKNKTLKRRRKKVKK